jgi:hypothetical protein
MRILFVFFLAALLGTIAGPRQQDAKSNRLAESDENEVLGVRSFDTPKYNQLAIRTHTQGDVQAAVQIRADGSVESVGDVNGPVYLINDITRALKSWIFVLKSPHPIRLQVTIRFSLSGPTDNETTSYNVSARFPNLLEIATNPMNTISRD